MRWYCKTSGAGPAPWQHEKMRLMKAYKPCTFKPVSTYATATAPFQKTRMGIILTVVIILADVAHNTYYVALKKQWLEPFYLSQVAFLIAVALLSPIVWRRAISRVALAKPILAKECG